MRTTLAALLALCILFAASANAQPHPSPQEDLGTWMTYYYLHPEPELLPEAFDEMTRFEGISDERLFISLSHFFAAALTQSPQSCLQFARAIEGNEILESLSLTTFWLQNNECGRESLKYAADNWDHGDIPERARTFAADPAPDVMKVRITQGMELDALWATFFATGEAEPISRIVDVAGEAEPEGSMIAVTSAANWSLKSNAQQHERVRDILQAMMEQSVGPRRNLLRSLLEQ